MIVYRLAADWTATLAQVEASLDSARFAECGPSQERSLGWVEPRGEAHGPLVEAVGGQWVLKMMIETKAVPAAVLNRKVMDQVAHIEATTGRKPGKKEKRDIKEELKLTLLPMAFSKQVAVTVWIDPTARLLVLVIRFINDITYQFKPRSNLFHRKMTGVALNSSMPLRMRAFSSSTDLTRMCRRKARAILEKAHSIRLSQEPCLGV